MQTVRNLNIKTNVVTWLNMKKKEELKYPSIVIDVSIYFFNLYNFLLLSVHFFFLLNQLRVA